MSSPSCNPRASRWCWGNARGPLCEKGPVRLGLSHTDHYSLHPQLLTAGSSHLDSFLLWQGGSQGPSVWGSTFTWAPGMCLSGRELSRFKGWRHNTIYLFTLYTGACHFINICISFLVPCSILGSVSLVLGTKISLKSLHCCMVLSHEGYKHMQNIKYDLYTCVSNI